MKGKQPYTSSKRISYHRSFKRLIDLGLIEMTWESIDVKEWEKFPSTEAPRTRRFKFFALTDKGMKEARKIRKQISKTVSEFQNLL